MENGNILYYGDNLDILTRYVKDETVDLVYLDPPFNSNANYNVLFKERDGSEAAGQIQAFEDTWTWNSADEKVFAGLVTAGGKVADCLKAFRTFLGPCDMLAYLVMMAPRLVQLRRVMKPTASIYLHCDPSASHYLKMLMDAVFGPENFLNEIIWKRTYSHGSAKRYGPLHDSILFFAKRNDYFWSNPKAAHDPDYIGKHFNYVDDKTGNKFQAISLTGAGVRHGESGKPWRDIDPTAVGRHWALPSKILKEIQSEAKSVQAALDALDAAGRVYWPNKDGGTPRLKWFETDTDGVAIPDIWTDIGPISAQASERLGYPTQKPEELLERIINASSNEGDLVLDPFCGCGTTIAAAQKLKRRWIGIDITHLAITLMKKRLQDTFGIEIEGKTSVSKPATAEAGAFSTGAAALKESSDFDKWNQSFRVVGEPTSLPDAAALAESDPYQFQWWALGLVGARPLDQKKGADKGIDGKIVFQGDSVGKFENVIISVKAGHTNVSQVRDLRGVLDREQAAIGVLISMEEPTKPMRTEAATAGHWESKMWAKQYPRLQLLTISELLAGEPIDMPPIRQVGQTFKKAERHKQKNVTPELPMT